MALKDKVITGVKWTSIASFIIIGSTVLKLSVLSRILEKADFGVIAIVNVFLGFINLLVDMGISSAIFHRKNVTQSQYASLYWTNIFFSILLYGVFFLLTPFISRFYEMPVLKSIIPLMGVSILFIAAGRQFKTIEEKGLNFKYVGAVEALAALIGLISAILLAIHGFGVYSLVFSVLFQHFFSNLFFFLKGLNKRNICFHFNFEDVRPFLKIGIYQIGSQMINHFNRDFDVLIFGKMFGPDITGAYSLAKQLVLRPAQVINPILTRVATPALAKVQENIQKLKESYLKLINVVSSINIPVYFFILIFAPAVVFVFYGNNYEEIVPFVRLLTIAMIVRALGNPAGSLVVATGRTDIEFRWNIFVTLVVPVVIFIGARFSIIVAVCSLVFVRVLLFFPAWRLLVFKLTGITLREFLKSIFDYKSAFKNIKYLKRL